jgi:hypothetical protein
MLTAVPADKYIKIKYFPRLKRGLFCEPSRFAEAAFLS